MTAAERQHIRAAINLDARSKLKPGRGSTSNDPRLRTGLWMPAIQKVQRQYIFSAISTEYGNVPD